MPADQGSRGISAWSPRPENRLAFCPRAFSGLPCSGCTGAVATASAPVADDAPQAGASERSPSTPGARCRGTGALVPAVAEDIVKLDDEERACLEERLREYRDLLRYLHSTTIQASLMSRALHLAELTAAGAKEIAPHSGRARRWRWPQNNPLQGARADRGQADSWHHAEVTTSPHVRRNREVWDQMSGWYQEKHGPQLNTRALAWGLWAVPESEVGALGPVSDKLVLELGCGGGQWSMFLADAGARPVGLDLSAEQLRAAARLMRTPYPVVQGDGESLPFRDASFELVLSDYGAMTWADPYNTVPEVARVLRPGGRLAFNTGTPWVWVSQPGPDAPPTDRLINPYFALHRIDEGDGATSFMLGYGDWVRLFRRSRLDIEDYIEIRPPEGASTLYDYMPLEWARRWPAEAIWVATRRP